MERMTRKETIVVRGKETAACNYENDDCDDQCRYGACRWQEKANMLLKKYEDTGLTQEQILSIATELKEYKQLGLSPKRLSGYIAFCKRYRELFGAMDFNQIQELVELHTPKQAVYESDGYSDGEPVYDTWICPNCGAKYEVDYDDYDFCPECGQRILR